MSSSSIQTTGRAVIVVPHQTIMGNKSTVLEMKANDELDGTNTRSDAATTSASASTTTQTHSVEEPRRSARNRTTTTMQIDCHTVLIKNNYTVTADRYVYDERPKKIAPTVPPPAKKFKAEHRSTVVREYKPTATQIERSRHNQRVMSSAQSKDMLRQSFLARHVDVLKPFCESAVITKLQSTPIVSYQPVIVQQPPKSIQATLRDYQMKGLNFMVNMHRQNLSMILGDEMGLVRSTPPARFDDPSCRNSHIFACFPTARMRFALMKKLVV